MLRARVAIRGLHSSRVVLNAPQKSPLQVFTETFKQEWKKSKELQDGIKELSDATGKLGESDAYKKAREAYMQAQKGSTVVGEALKKTGETVEKVAVKAWESDAGKVTRKVVNATAAKVDEAIEPVRQTKVYKDMSEVIDDGSSSRYGGFASKDARRTKREEDLKSGKRTRAVKSDDEAGTALVATKHKAPKESLGKKVDEFKEKTALGRFLTETKLKLWDDNENSLIVGMRTVTEKIGGLFAETESAQVIRGFKQIDPTFNTEDFTAQLRDYIIPEVLEAYVKGDEAVLKNWFSEAPYNVYAAQQKQFKEQQLFADGRILDIRGVEIVSAKLIAPANVPALVVGCRAQEIHLYRKAKTGEIAAGTESNIVLSSYAMVLTRDPEHIDDEETEGWKIMEFVRGGSRQFT